MAENDRAAIWTVKLPVSVKKEGEVFVASIPALDIVTQGDSREDAMAMLEEAASIVMEHCLEKGTWMQFLAECGVTPTRHSVAVSKPPVSARTHYLEFPAWMLSNVEQTASGHG